MTMRWRFWQREKEVEPAPYDPRLSWSEAESLHSLMVAASTAEDLGETELRKKLLHEAETILRRGTPPPSIASVRSLTEVPAASLPLSDVKSRKP